MYKLVIALLVEMRIELADNKGVKMVKKTLTVEQYILKRKSFATLTKMQIPSF